MADASDVSTPPHPQVPKINLQSMNNGSKSSSIEKKGNQKGMHEQDRPPYDTLNSGRFASFEYDDDYEEYEEELNRSKYEKAMKLEDELRTAQQRYDKIIAEVNALRKVLRVKEATEVKMRIHLEDERLQVRRVESALRKASSQLNSAEEEYKNALAKETQELKLTMANMKYIAPEDQLDILIKLENRDERGQAKIEAAERLLRDLNQEAANKDKAIEEASAQLNQAKAYAKDIELECENTRLKKEIQDLNDELVMLQQYTRTKTTQLEELNDQLNDYAPLELAHAKLKKQAALLIEEAEGYRYEIDIVTKEKARTLDSIHELSQRKPLDRVALKRLEAEKRRQYQSIKKNKVKLEQTQKSVAFHQHELSQLYGRMAKLNAALSSLEDFESLAKSTQMPVDQFKALVTSVDQIRAKEQHLTKQINEYDADVERVEYANAILEKSKSSAAKQKSQKIIELNSTIAAIRGEMEELEESHLITMAELQRQYDALQQMQ